MDGTAIAALGVIVALGGLLALHVFRGPNVTISVLESRIHQLEKDVIQLRLKLAEEHYAKGEIRDMFSQLRETVHEIKEIVEGLRNGRRAGDHR